MVKMKSPMAEAPKQNTHVGRKGIGGHGHKVRVGPSAFWRLFFSVGNVTPEDDSEAASDEILIIRPPAMVSSSEVSASITSPNPGLEKKIKNSGRLEQR